MRTKFKILLVLIIMAVGIACSMSMTAFAQTDAQARQNAGAIPETVVTESESGGQARSTSGEGSVPFSIPGNGELLDNKTDDGTKQFLTIQTKSGNTFFLVMDHSSDTENVYMLSMIDENDLSEFTKEKEQPSVVLPETETTPTVESQETSADQEENGESHNGAILALVLFLIGAVGVGYYFKVVKPRRAEEQTEDEGLEFDDGERLHSDQDEPDKPEEEHETL